MTRALLTALYVATMGAMLAVVACRFAPSARRQPQHDARDRGGEGEKHHTGATTHA